LKVKPPVTRRRTGKRTELRRASAQATRRLAKEAAEREWRVFLTAKFDRTWKAMIRFRKKVRAPRFRELMAELPSTVENIGSSDQRGVAEFFVLLGPERFGAYLAELVETLEMGSDPGAFWAKWIGVVVERTPIPHSLP
jgi:hypothetical protein